MAAWCSRSFFPFPQTPLISSLHHLSFLLLLYAPIPGILKLMSNCAIDLHTAMAVTSFLAPVNHTLASSSSSISSIVKPSVTKPCFGCECGDEECDFCICTVM